MASSSGIPSSASAAVLKPSEPMPDFAVSVVGPNFDEGIDLQKLLDSYSRIGFQANSLGKAIDIVNKMVRGHVIHILQQLIADLTSDLGDCPMNPSPRTRMKNSASLK